MTIFKSTYEILNSPWENKSSTLVKKVPPKWQENRDINIEDVVMWEQIYHQPGNIGIYVAWSPIEEFYLVVYDLFSKTSFGIKTFRGFEAIPQILSLCSILEIELSINRIQI